MSPSSKCQATVALSTVKAKYVAMSVCTANGLDAECWLDEVKIPHTLMDHGKVKHIEIQHHYIWENMVRGY